MSAAKSPEVVDGMIDDSLLGILIILFVVMLSTGYVYIQQLQQANGQPQGTQQLPGRRAPTAAAVQTAVSKRATVSTAGLTERQLRLHYSLPLRNGARTVTICTEALLTNENSATLAWKSEDVPSLLADLARVADVYLLCTVADAKDAASMQRIRDFVATNPDLKSSDATNAGVKAHKILFCTTTIGKVAFVRQIEPHVHVEVNADAVRDLEKHVPRVIHVAATPLDAVTPSIPNVVHVTDSFAAYFSLLSAKERL